MIWCVEDDAGIRDIEVYALQSAGLEAKGFVDGLSFWNALETEKEKPELVMLDMMLPGIDGLELLKRMKASAGLRDIPVIMATAKGMEYDKVQSLDIGADDYLVKPFYQQELLARVRALLRRYDDLGSIREVKPDGQLRVGGIVLNTAAKQLIVRGEAVRLTATEFKILQVLMSNPGRVFSAEEIYEKVWENDAYAVENTVMVHISRIREKLELNPKKPEYLKVVWGIGYVFEAP